MKITIFKTSAMIKEVYDMTGLARIFNFEEVREEEDGTNF